MKVIRPILPFCLREPLLFPIKQTFRTLRFRIAAWNALVVVLTATLTLLMVREGVRIALLHELDLILAEDVQEVVLALSEPGSSSLDTLIEELQRKALGHQQHGWFATLWGADEQLIWSSDPQAAQAAPTGVIIQRESLTVGDLRLIEKRIKSSAGPVRAIQVGASTEFLRDEMSRIDRSVLIAGVVVVLIAPICGYWLASRATRPVGEIISQANTMRASHLDERLPVRNTGDELDRLAQTFNGLLDRIAEYVAKRRDFLANAAHELRTPLSAIHSSLEVSLTSERSSDQYRELLEELLEQTSSLETLVNQLLLLSETETDRWKDRGEPVELHDVVARSVDMFEAVAESKGVALSLERSEEAIVIGMRYHYWQVVNNLLDNAIKYTLPGGRVDVTLERKEERAVLTVRDTGVGIPAADIPQVFDRFFRLDRSRSRAASVRGTGLGLSICQAVVQALGGSIWCESEEGRGSTFVVELPLAVTAIATLSTDY